MSWVLALPRLRRCSCILHEVGHFTAAKAVGMRVERFSLFFPPLIAKVRRGETEYAIGAIPLGGYVKITGMNPAEEIPPEVAHRAYYRQPVWKRIVVIAAGPAVNIVLAFLILWVLYICDRARRAARRTSARWRRARRPPPCCSRATRCSRSTARSRRATTSTTSSPWVGKQDQRAATARPVTLTVRRDGEVHEGQRHAVLRRQAQAPATGSASATRRHELRTPARCARRGSP